MSQPVPLIAKKPDDCWVFKKEIFNQKIEELKKDIQQSMQDLSEINQEWFKVELF